MLKLLSCNCGSAEPLMRQLLREAGVSNWMALGLTKGKEQALAALDAFPEPYHALLSYRALHDHLEKGGTFVVLVGYDEQTFYWSDIAANTPKDRIEALALLKRFA